MEFPKITAPTPWFNDHEFDDTDDYYYIDESLSSYYSYKKPNKLHLYWNNFKKKIRNAFHK